MAGFDYLLCGGYLAMVLAAGWWARPGGGEAPSAVNYFLAGRRAGWVPVGISVMVSVFSAVNFAAFPAEVAEYGLAVLISLPVFVLVAWPVTRWIIPLVRSLPMINAYGYLQRRFDARVCRLATGIFLLWRVMWMAATLWACGMLTSGITGWPVALVIAVAGAVAIAYTSLGGLRAVFFTDVAQCLVLLGSVAVAVALVAAREGGLAAMLAAGHGGGRLMPFAPVDWSFFSLDPRMRITFFSGIIGTLVIFMTRYGADQMVLQRYMAARSEADAVRGLWLNVVVSLVVLLLLALLGVAAYVDAAQAGRDHLPGAQQVAMLLRSLPPGVLGLMVAGVLAAAMSSMDSGLNACAAVWSRLNSADPGEAAAFTQDGPASEPRSTGRTLTVLLGASVIALSFAVGQLGTLFEIASRIINGLGSPLLAMMMLARFSRRANAHGMFYGGLIGTAASIAFSFGVTGISLHLYAVANLIMTLLLAYVLSLCAPRRRHHP
jgi:solute:Na+ symporter, SSS family